MVSATCEYWYSCGVAIGIVLVEFGENYRWRGYDAAFYIRPSEYGLPHAV